jgi:lauroyl/myristoyl acyltransferase
VEPAKHPPKIRKSRFLLLGTWYLVPGTLFSTACRLPPLILSLLLATLYYLSGIRRSVVNRNLDLVLGKRPLFFRWKLAFNLFQDAFSLLFGYHPRAGGDPRSPSRLSSHLSSRSQTHLAALRSGPSLLLAAHFHNWEAQASVLARLGVPLLGAARPLKTPWAERLLRAVRARRGVPVIHDDIPRRALRHLRTGGCFGFLWDQHSPASLKQALSEPGTFFGHPVSLNPLPFLLLESESCPVYFGAWLPGGELRIIPLLNPVGKDPGAARACLERRYHRVLQTLIKRHPTYWYGFLHARFKTLGPYPGHRKGR